MDWPVGQRSYWRRKFTPPKVEIFIFVFLLIFYIGLKKGLERSMAVLDKALQDLLTLGYDDGFLTINIAYTRKYIQFKKYVRSQNEYGIELLFPNVKWSHNYFMKLQSLCKRNKIQFLIKKRDSIEFLCIDYGQDINLAHSFVKKIFVEVFELDKHAKFFVRLGNAATMKSLA